MKEFLIALCLFAVIIGTVVLATRDEFSDNRPKTPAPIAHTPVVCTKPRVEPAIHTDPPKPQPVKIIERVKVIQTVKVVQVPITKIYVKEVYHTQQVVYVPIDRTPPVKRTSYLEQLSEMAAKRTQNSGPEDERSLEWEYRKATNGY